jgi:hypothetical protein
MRRLVGCLRRRVPDRLITASTMALATLALSGNPALARPHYAWQSSYRAVVDQTAAVVQGIVTEIAESYTEEEGPRTLVTLSRVNVLWGDFRDESVTLKLFGGPVPGRPGRIDEVHVPTFVRGKTYLVFLSNRDWRLSPVTARQSYLVELVHGKEIVVTTDGFAVAGIDDVTGPIPLFPVYNIPDEIDENFEPRISEEVTPDLVARAASPAELVADLQSWAQQNQVTVNGTFNDQPYRTANWRFPRMTPDPTDPPRDPVFEPRTDRPFSPAREQNACGDRSDLPPCPDDNEGGAR